MPNTAGIIRNDAPLLSISNKGINATNQENRWTTELATSTTLAWEKPVTLHNLQVKVSTDGVNTPHPFLVVETGFIEYYTQFVSNKAIE